MSYYTSYLSSSWEWTLLRYCDVSGRAGRSDKGGVTQEQERTVEKDWSCSPLSSFFQLRPFAIRVTREVNVFVLLPVK